MSLKTSAMKIFTLLFCLLASSFQMFAGGGWNAGKGNGYFKFGQSIIVADRYFTPAGDIIPITTIGQYISYGYAEYGISDRLDLTAYVPFFSRATLNQLNDINGEVITRGDQLNSVGDTDITFKYGLIQNSPTVISLSLTLGLPLGNPAGGTSGSLQTGDGEFNQMIRADISRSFDGFYSSAYVGYNHRTNNFTHELRYGVETGKPFKNWYFILRIYGIKPLFEGEGEVSGQINGLFGNQIEYLAFTPEVNYQITDQWGLSASLGGAFYGKRVLATPNYGVGVYFKLL